MDSLNLPDARKVPGNRFAGRDIRGMNKFDLCPVEGGVELRGGQLEAPMIFREADAEQRAIKLGGVSQREGGVVRVLDDAGVVVATIHDLENQPLSRRVICSNQNYARLF